MNYAEKQRITLIIMQAIHLDQTDRRILDLLQTEPGINASEIGEKIGLSQSAVWRRIQSLREDGVIREQPVKLDREKVGLNTMVFAHVGTARQTRSRESRAQHHGFCTRQANLARAQQSR
jgi:DNA-binding Lrp family transcriptional regulator